MYKPKSTRDIYEESFSVNSANIEKQLAEQSVPAKEIRDIIGMVGKMYHDRLEKIVEECGRDMMALERVPSPLRLFVTCLADAKKSMNLSEPARALIGLYTSAWEDWM